MSGVSGPKSRWVCVRDCVMGSRTKQTGQTAAGREVAAASKTAQPEQWKKRVGDDVKVPQAVQARKGAPRA